MPAFFMSPAVARETCPSRLATKKPPAPLSGTGGLK